MGVNEPFRCIVVGHLRLIAALVIVPVLVVLATRSTGERRYAATARVQASSATLGSDTEADSLLNRVKGVATSPGIVDTAMKAAHITGRGAYTVAAHDVSVTRLGSSPVMDVTVTDVSPTVARRLSDALADAVVGFLAGPGSAQPKSLVDQLTAQQTRLYDQRKQVVAQLDVQTGTNRSAGLSAQLSTIDQELGDLGATLRQLQVALVTDSSASVISYADKASAVRASSALSLVLAGTAGLVGGVLLAALREIWRPRLADARAVARELGVPLLGAASPPRPQNRLTWLFARLIRPIRRQRTAASGAAAGGERVPDRETVLALRQAALRSGARTIALVDTGRTGATTDLARLLTARLSAGAPSTNGHGPADAVLVTTPRPSPGQATRGVGTVTAQRTNGAKTARIVVNEAPERERPIRVVPIGDLAVRDADRGWGLLVVATPLSPGARLEWLRDFTTATGWPVIGVLAAKRSTRRSAR